MTSLSVELGTRWSEVCGTAVGTTLAFTKTRSATLSTITLTLYNATKYLTAR